MPKGNKLIFGPFSISHDLLRPQTTPFRFQMTFDRPQMTRFLSLKISFFRIAFNNQHQENVVLHVIVVQSLQKCVRRLKLVLFCPVHSRTSLLLIKSAAQNANIVLTR